MDRNLMAFLAIAREGTLSGAADRLALTQPSLTKRLANLEDELGTQLFLRHRRGMDLTAAGRMFLARASRIEQEYLQVNEELQALSEAGLDVLRIGAGPLFHLRYVAPLFARLRARFPALTLNLFAQHNPVTLPMLRDGQIDVVLGAIEPLDPTLLIAAIPVAVVEQAVVMRIDDPLAGRRHLHPADLAKGNWVAYSAHTEDVPLLAQYFARHGLAGPKIIARSSTFSTALDLTRHLGARMMAPLQLAGIIERAGLKAIAVDPPIGRQSTGAYVRQSGLAVPVIRQLLKDLRDLAGGPPDQDLSGQDGA